MEPLVKISILALLVSGCHTVGFHRIVKNEISPPSAIVGEFSPQSFRFPDEEITLDIQVTRWDYRYYVNMQIINESKSEVVKIEPKQVSFYSIINSANLKLNKFEIVNNKTVAAAPDIITLAPNHKIIINYEFHGGPVMGIIHPITTEAQKKIRFDVRGLSRQKPIPFGVSLEPDKK